MQPKLGQLLARILSEWSGSRCRLGIEFALTEGAPLHGPKMYIHGNAE